MERSYVHSRRVGDVTVTAINDAVMPSKIELNVPEGLWREAIEADAEGKAVFDSHVFLVQTAHATILVDTGLDDPGSSWDVRWRDEDPGSVRTPGVVAGLASIGVRPEDVTHILITHVHFDHVLGLAAERNGQLVPRYPNARVLIGRADWEGAAEDHLGPEQRARIGVVAEAGQLDLVDNERDVVPGVSMISAPGESPGHSLIRVSSGGEELYLVGDLFHFGAEVEHLDWMVPWADENLMSTSRKKLLAAVAGTEAIVAFTHETFPPWGRTVGDEAGGYRWERAE